MVRGAVSSQPLCCPCNGSRARCVRCLCARRGHTCTNCTAGSCQNTSVPRTENTVSLAASQAETQSQPTVPVASASPAEGRESQQLFNALREVLPIAHHSLPTYDRARDDYTWGDRSAAEVTPLLEAAYQEVMHWRSNLFVPPVGNVANDLVTEMTRLITNFVEKTGLERIALTAFFLLPHLVLQLPASRRSAAKRKAMTRRLEAWRAGRFEELLEEGRAIQVRLPTTQNNTGWRKGFVRLMLSGRSSAAMRLLRKGSYNGVLKLDECIEDEKVRDILRQKHPSPTAANEEFIESAPLPGSQLGHSVLFEGIDSETITKAVMATHGSAGPSGLDANAWRQLLTGYRPSQQLAEAIAGFARRISTELVDPVATAAYTSSRLVPLDKNPGVRPVGIGEVVRRIVGKAILRVFSADIRRVAGGDQLCVGQRAGIESAIHELRTSFNSSNEQCLLQIDADNAFNSLNRSLLLHNIEKICPLLKVILLNTYRKDSFLPVAKELLYSREGLTQGDNLAMAAFGANTLPLIKRLKEQLPDSILQKWYADDANVTGELPALLEFLDQLTRIGPNYGYRVNTKKCWLVVHPGKEEEARRVFDGIPINITEEGHQILGSAIGTHDFLTEFTSARCEEYVQEAVRLAEIAQEEPHLAYAALVHCLQAQWLHLLRTTPNVSLHRVDDVITTRLLPVLLKRPAISEVEREWIALPVREGGLSITVWSQEQSSHEYDASRKICRPLSEDIPWEECERRQKSIASQIRHERVQKRQKQSASLHGKLNSYQQRAREVAKEKGAASWLHTRPLEAQGYHLTANEFHDAVALRMGWTPSDLPKKCQCGTSFEVSHALSCPLGGFPTHRHDETRDLLADVMTEVGNSVAIEPTLTPVEGRVFQQSTTTTEPNARLDIVAGGIWGGRFERAFFDVCVFNAFAQSNAAKSLPTCYEFHERRKVAKYGERVREVEHSSFVPLVFSSSGGAGPLTLKTIKRLAFLISKKRKIVYSDAINWLRRRLSFSLLRASSQGLRGARSKLHAPQRLADTSITATNSITVPHNN